MKSKTTILRAYCTTGGSCTILFDEIGWKVLNDTRQSNLGYLHMCEESAPEITEKCRNSIIRYFYGHAPELPGLGASPQQAYWKNLSIKNIEDIGNNGKMSYYA